MVCLGCETSAQVAAISFLMFVPDPVGQLACFPHKHFFSAHILINNSDCDHHHALLRAGAQNAAHMVSQFAYVVVHCGNMLFALDRFGNFRLAVAESHSVSVAHET